MTSFLSDMRTVRPKAGGLVSRSHMACATYIWPLICSLTMAHKYIFILIALYSTRHIIHDMRDQRRHFCICF